MFALSESKRQSYTSSGYQRQRIAGILTYGDAFDTTPHQEGVPE